MSQNNTSEEGLQIKLTDEMAGGTYANLAIISHSHAEIITDYIRVMPGANQAPVVSRIILAPEHAKRLLFALQDNIVKYEQQFGTIVLPEAQQAAEQNGRTATPFGLPEGKA